MEEEKGFLSSLLSQMLFKAKRILLGVEMKINVNLGKCENWKKVIFAGEIIV